MSHVVTYEARFVDLQCLKRCCDRNKWGFYQDKKTLEESFCPNRDCTAAIQLPNWCYPVFVDSQGSIHFDNYNGSWGDEQLLNKLKQEYAREACYMQAESQGYMVTSETYNDQGTLVMELCQY